jgi:lysophospholipase L1-like esterase
MPVLAAEPPAWVEAMRAVHRDFRGQAGYVAQFGDSITYSMAFWTPIGWDEPDQYLTAADGWPQRPAEKRWRDTLQGFRAKGPEHGNYSGWRVGNVLKALDAVLEREKPEAAIIMVGTNDISGGKVPEGYRDGLEQIVRKCIAAHCVPLLSTIPPRRGHLPAVADANRIIRDVAQQQKVPLIDYGAECLRRRPGESWDGTLISDDGVHPSGGKTNVYTDENLQTCGYALRNWVTFLAVRELYFRVLSPPK